MHAMLQELGKQIVRGPRPDEPRFWSRLWLYEDFHHVMMTERKEIEVKAIVLDQKEDGFQFNELNAEDLSQMRHLKLLILCHKNFSGRPIFLSNCLRYLSWNGYPFTSLPSNFLPYDLVELNMSNSSIEQLWEGMPRLPHLKRMDLSNSKNLRMTPRFQEIRNLERLDLTGCINLSQVHPSIGLLSKLVFLSLQNCSSLVSLDFDGIVSRLSSLKVLRLSDCTKLENTPDFIGALKLEYLDMDRCTSLSMIHKSIGDLAKLIFLSLRDCTNLVRIPDNFNNLTSLITLDVSFCNILAIPDAIGELRCLERLDLQGNDFYGIPDTIMRLSSLAYLNLSHCQRLVHLPELPAKSAQSVGRYFKTTSGSRDHRSGLYVFNCPMMTSRFRENEVIDPIMDLIFRKFAFKWLQRLVQQPCHFRCGFDIVLPCNLHTVPRWFNHRFNGGSIIKASHSNMHVDWVGFVFCVSFAVNNHHALPGTPLPHPFYLSFESDHTEERFDMPLSLELNKVDGSNYLWTIYISREHCHFMETGARITFKAHQGLIIQEWGLHMLTDKDFEAIGNCIFERWELNEDYVEGIGNRIFLQLEVIGNVEESSSFEPKIQLPYNWLVSDEDEVENDEAKGKEINLSNLGLLIGRPQ